MMSLRRGARGRFVVDVIVSDSPTNQTFLVASGVNKVAITETRTVTIHVSR
jgi:hypothetical protein